MDIKVADGFFGDSAPNESLRAIMLFKRFLFN